MVCAWLLLRWRCRKPHASQLAAFKKEAERREQDLSLALAEVSYYPPTHTRAHARASCTRKGRNNQPHSLHTRVHARMYTHTRTTHAHTHTHTRTHVRCHHYRCHCHSRWAHCVHLPWCPQAMQRCATLTTSAVLQHKQQPKQPPQASGYMEGYGLSCPLSTYSQIK